MRWPMPKTYKKKYLLEYKNNQTGELDVWYFTAKNDEHAYILANDYCDKGWHKYYGVMRIR
jgi:hypothetical protein